MRFLDAQNFFDEQQDLLFIEDKLLRCIVDYSSGELINQCSDLKYVKSFAELKDLSLLFSDCFIEIFSIKIKFRLISNSYGAILFMHELVKTLTKNNIPSNACEIIEQFAKTQRKWFENEFTRSIQFKNIGNLTCISYFRKLIEFNCTSLVEHENTHFDNELNSILNEILSENNSPMKNSLQILALKIFYKNYGSFYKLKEFLLPNPNIEWKGDLIFGEPKSSLDIHVKSEKLTGEVERLGKLLLECFNSKNTNNENNELKQILLDKYSQPHTNLSLILAIFNSLYLPNSNEIFYGKDNFNIFIDYVEKHIESDFIRIEEKKKFSNFVLCLMKNFPDHKNSLHLSPTTDVNTLKINSIIFDCYAIVIANSNDSNTLSSLFFKNNAQSFYWPCSVDCQSHFATNQGQLILGNCKIS